MRLPEEVTDPLPAVDELRRERARFMETLDSLTDVEFDTGPTLCAGWSPRDVLAHVIGTDRIGVFLRGGRLRRVNDLMVQRGRAMSRAELSRAGWRAAEDPSRFSRALALPMLGDVAVHHQDVVRGLGRSRELPTPVAAAIFRAGINLGTWKGATLLHYRVVPTTPGGRPLGRGRRVRGTTEALGMWMAGRDCVAAELEFG